MAAWKITLNRRNRGVADMGPGDPVLCVQPADTPGDLYPECDRALAVEATPGGAHAWHFLGDEAAMQPP